MNPLGDGSYLAPRILQGLGILLLIGAAVFWGVTGRESALIVASAMSLIGLGAYQHVRQGIQEVLAGEKTAAAIEKTEAEEARG